MGCFQKCHHVPQMKHNPWKVFFFIMGARVSILCTSVWRSATKFGILHNCGLLLIVLRKFDLGCLQRGYTSKLRQFFVRGFFLWWTSWASEAFCCQSENLTSEQLQIFLETQFKISVWFSGKVSARASSTLHPGTDVVITKLVCLTKNLAQQLSVGCWVLALSAGVILHQLVRTCCTRHTVPN